MATLKKYILPNSIYDYELHSATKIKAFSYEGQTLYAKVVDIYDGDTVTLVFRYRGKLQQYSCRMLGYDSPEMKPPKIQKDRDKEIQAAKAAKEALANLIGFPDKSVILKAKCGKFDKYGRILVTLYLPPKHPVLRKITCGCCNSEPIEINQWMMDQGHGIPYDGGTKKKFTKSQ